jgi:hypothetical protein
VWFNKQTDDHKKYLRELFYKCGNSVGLSITLILVILRAQECNFPYLLKASEFGTHILAMILSSLGLEMA